MWDIILAVLGRKWCGWCVNRDDTWFSTLMGGKKHHYQQNKLQQWYWVTYLEFMDTHLPVWKLGQRWHFRHHVREPLTDE